MRQLKKRKQAGHHEQNICSEEQSGPITGAKRRLKPPRLYPARFRAAVRLPARPAASGGRSPPLRSGLWPPLNRRPLGVLWRSCPPAPGACGAFVARQRLGLRSCCPGPLSARRAFRARLLRPAGRLVCCLRFGGCSASRRREAGGGVAVAASAWRFRPLRPPLAARLVPPLRLCRSGCRLRSCACSARGLAPAAPLFLPGRPRFGGAPLARPLGGAAGRGPARQKNGGEGAAVRCESVLVLVLKKIFPKLLTKFAGSLII